MDTVKERGNRVRVVPQSEFDYQASVLGLSTADLETLMKLQEAGVIKLDALMVPAVDSRLTDWTYDELKRHMIGVQDLRWRSSQGEPSTAMHRFTYLKFLETHPVVPVQLRPPSEPSWIDHLSFRREEDSISNTGVDNYRKAILSLLKFLGLEIWPSLAERPKYELPGVRLPPDDLIPRYWMELPHPDRYLRETYMHMNHWGFHVGPRPPSELAVLRLDDIEWDSRTVAWAQVKKGGKVRVAEDLPTFLVNGRTCKSLRNYCEYVRPRVDKGLSDEFFLDKNGRAFSPSNMGADLAEAGRGIWPSHHNYVMRHWAVTQHLIENDFNVYRTARWVDDTVHTIEKHYIDHARARAAMRGGGASIRRRQRSTR